MKKQIVELIEFIGKHPFATGLLALLSIIGFILSIIGFNLDRKESAEATRLGENIRDSVNRLNIGNAKNPKGYIQNAKVGDTREKVIAELGPPDWRRNLTPDEKFSEKASLSEAFMEGDILFRIAVSPNNAIENFCVTTLLDGAIYLTSDGVEIGKDNFASLMLVDFPLDATIDQSNWQGDYRYEETGFAPSVIREASKDGLFSYHAIRDFNAGRSPSGYLPVLNVHQGRHWMRSPDALVDPMMIEATKVNYKYSDQYPSFEPPSFQKLFDEFRKNNGPDTFCTGGTLEFRNSNIDLEQHVEGFQEYLRGQ